VFAETVQEIQSAAIQISDARLKKGITNLRYGVSQVMQLLPVTFQWKDGSDKRTNLGLLAQEVERVMPEMIEKGLMQLSRWE